MSSFTISSFPSLIAFFFKKKMLYVFIWERARAGWRKGAEERNKQTPRWAQSSIPQPWDHNQSQNQELDAQPTPPPRHPKELIFRGGSTAQWYLVADLVSLLFYESKRPKARVGLHLNLKEGELSKKTLSIFPLKSLDQTRFHSFQWIKSS